MFAVRAMGPFRDHGAGIQPVAGPVTARQVDENLPSSCLAPDRVAGAYSPATTDGTAFRGGGFGISDGFISPLDLVEIGLMPAEEARELHARRRHGRPASSIAQ